MFHFLNVALEAAAGRVEVWKRFAAAVAEALGSNAAAVDRPEDEEYELEGVITADDCDEDDAAFLREGDSGIDL